MEVGLELRHLRYFVAVAEERHITRAAARLGMAQPPLSQQIKALETELGATLLCRLPSGVALTAAGEMLLEEARSILEHADRAAARVRLAGRGQYGELRLGITTSAALHPLVSRLLRGYAAGHAGVSLDLHESNAAELTEELLRGERHAGLMRAPVGRPPDLLFRRLLDEPLLLALPADHRLLDGHPPDAPPPVPLAALAGEKFILVRRRSAPGLYADIVQACREVGFEPDVVAEVGRMLTNLNLVAAGIGISFVPASMRHVRREGIVYCAIQDRPDLVAPLTLVWRRDETRRTVRDFIELAVQLVAHAS